MSRYIVNSFFRLFKYVETGFSGITTTSKESIDPKRALSVTPLRKKCLQGLLLIFTLPILLPTADAAADTVYSINNNGSVSFIETGNDAVTVTISLPSGSNPTALCLNPVTTHAYTLNSATNSISVLDTTLQTVISTISDGTRLTGVSTIACDPTGKSVLIGNNDTSGATSKILYLNTATLALDSLETVVGNNPGSIVFNKSGSKAYVLSQGVPSISVIDTSTKQVTTTTPLLDADAPYALAMHTQDTYLYVVNLTGNTVTFINPSTMEIDPTPVAVGRFPNSLAVSNTTNTLYVADYLDTVTLVDPVSKSSASTFSTPFPGAIIERNDGRRIYVASMSDDIIRSYNTSSLTTAPALISLLNGSSPRALATLSGVRHGLGLSVSGSGVGSVNWPFNIVFTAPTPVSGSARVPEGIVVVTNAVADVCSTAGWTGCDSVSGGGSRSAFCTVNPFTADKVISAHFTANAMRSITYTISGGNGAISCPIQVCDGANALCSITPATGFTLTSLTDNGSDILGNVTGGAAFQILNIVANHSIVAGFTLSSFNVTASIDANGSISPNTVQTVAYGNPVSFTLTPNPGFSLVSVSGCSGSRSGNSYTTGPITGDCSVSASFTPNTFTITSQTPGGGGLVSCLPTAVLLGGSAICTVNPNAGYHLTTLNDNGTDKISAVIGTSYQISNVTANHDVVALFAINQYAIALNSGPNGSISGPTTVNYGDKPTYAFSPSTGYHVSGVIVGGVSAGAVSNYTFSSGVTGPVTISATFVLNQYQVTTAADTGGAISPSNMQNVNYGNTVSFTVTPDSANGFKIDSVTGCGGTLSGNTYTTAPVTSPCTVAAAFTLNQYPVTPTAGTGGSISPAIVQNITHGGSTGFTITPDTANGFKIDSVTGCGGSLSGSIYTTGTITTACSVAATFTLNKYQVTPSAGTGGIISPATVQNIAHGGTAGFTVTPGTASGYKIASVTGCGGTLSGSTYTTGTITSACTVAAGFILEQYAVTQTAGAGGSITPNSAPNVTYGSTASFTVTPDSANGFKIDLVTGCGGTLSGNTYTTAPVTSPCTVAAAFTLNQYPVTSTAGTGGSISPAIVQNITHGGSTGFTITPDTANGYSIVSVSGCGGTLSGSIYTTGAITANCTMSAVFEINSYGITTSIPGGNGAVSCTPNPAYFGTSVSCTAVPANVYQLASLIDNGIDVLSTTNTTSYTINNITANHALAATFELKKYAVTVSVGANGRSTPRAAQMVTRGNTTNFSLLPDAGFHVVTPVNSTCGGTLNGATYKTDPIIADCSVAVEYEPNQYTVAATAGNGGSITPGTRSISHGSSATFSVVAASGYSIDSVSGCGGALFGGIFNTWTIYGACSISATFIAIPAVSSSIPGGNGIVTCSTPVVAGDNVLCLITPDNGYHLSGLTDNGVSVLSSVTGRNSYSLNGVTSSHSITAEFAAYSLADALRALRIAVGIVSPASDEYVWLDVAPLETEMPKGDGMINIMDALVLLKQTLGTYTSW